MPGLGWRLRRSAANSGHRLWRKRRGETVANKLFVRNLPRSVTAEELRSFLADFGYGVAKVDIVQDRASGRPNGFAFVTLSNLVDVRDAVENLSNTVFKGQTIRVNEAKQLRPRNAVGRGIKTGFQTKRHCRRRVGRQSERRMRIYRVRFADNTVKHVRGRDLFLVANDPDDGERGFRCVPTVRCEALCRRRG